MKLLDKYNKLEQEIYEYFGYKEQWQVYPINDNRDYYWTLNGDSEVLFWDSKEDYEKCPNDPDYSDEIMTGFKRKDREPLIFEGKDYTAIIVDTNCDNNRFFAIFDNSKRVELKDEE